MSKFIKVDNNIINTSDIVDVTVEMDRMCSDTYNFATKHGRQFQTTSKTFEHSLLGSNRIVSVIPAPYIMYNVFKQTDGNYYLERAHLLGLCEDGILRGIILTDGGFSIPEFDTDNYYGLYTMYQIKEGLGIDPSNCEIFDPNQLI